MQLANPYAWLLFVIALITLAGLPFVWRRRNAPGARPFLALLGGITVWSLGYACELFSVRSSEMLLWAKIEYFGIVTVINAFLVVAVEYSGRSNLVTRRTMPWLFIHPLVVLVLVWTDPLHGLIFKNVTVIFVDGMLLLKVVEHGLGFWIHSVYAYLLLLAGTVLLIHTARRSSDIYRGQVISLLVAAIVPWVSNLIYLSGILPLDPTPLAFSITAAALALSLSRYQLFDVLPIARDWLVETMDDAVVVLDDQGRIVDANRAVWSLMRYQSSLTISRDLAGKPWERLFASWQDQLNPLLAAREARGEINLGTEMVPHWFEVRVLPFSTRREKLTHNRMVGRLLVFHDIQDRKQSEEMMAEARDQALQANLLKSQLLANVSHDLRTPLNAILGFGEMLLEGAYGPLHPSQLELVRQIFLSAQQMDLFVGDLLDQAMIEKGKLTLNPTQFQPSDFLSGLRSLVGRTAQEKGLELNLSIDRSMPPVLFGDVKRLTQVAVNLVNNAIKYTDQGEVNVSLKCQGDRWMMIVSDTGIGISGEAQSYIFEPFRQAEGVESRRRGGAGLGLSIVRYLVTMMGGHIELTSVPGKGSTFRVVLPLNHVSGETK